jgi:NADH-quinone oxidoreductase subunit K
MVPITYYLGLSAIIFTIGVLGVLTRRNSIVIFMSLELMFNAANLVFIAFASLYQNLDGQLFVFFVIAVAAAEVGVGLAIIIAIFRARNTIDVDSMNSMKG